jgi:hypothetical protein
MVSLPTYSLDLNPMGEALSMVKALLKKASPRRRVALVWAIGRALWALTPEDTNSWFSRCSYEAEAQGL